MTDTLTGRLTASLAASDPEVARLVDAEGRRQRESMRLIASENYVSRAVLEATGTVLTNKYSEGYAGKRYYEGQQVIDQVEQLAIDRAKALFGVDHANVQPYSGSPANLAVYLAFLQPGDTVHGDGAADGWAPDSRMERVRHRQVVPCGALRRAEGGPAASTWTRCASSPSANDRS